MWQGAPGKAGPVGCNGTLVEAGGWIFDAPDIAALSEKCGLPAPALAETIRCHNEAASGAGTLDIPRTAHRTKPWKFEHPPFHAAPLCAGITGTMGGIEIDDAARALRPDGRHFPGLYAVGTPVAYLEGGPRAGYVGGLCKAFVLGLLAAEHIAATR